MINEPEATAFLTRLFDGRILLTVAAFSIGGFALGALFF